jgi:hypothetical protein
VRRVATGVALVGALVLITAPPAGAHTVTGVKPANFASRVTSMQPPIPGVGIRLLDLGRRVQLHNGSHSEVVVLGTTGKPFVHVKAGATRRWRDARTSYAGRSPAGGGRIVSSWSIDLVQAGRAQPTVVRGIITYVPPPSPWPWIAVTLAVLAGTVALAWTAAWGRWLSIALAVLLASDALQSYGTAAATHEALIAQLGRILLGGVVTAIAWIVGAFALPALQRNHEGGLLAAGGVGVVIASFSGATDVAVFGSSQVASIFPAVTARLAVVCAIGIGVGLVGATIAVIARNPELRPRVVAETATGMQPPLPR